MKLVRYLIDATLSKSTNVKQPNGVYKKNLVYQNTYKVQKQELTDDVSATIYGADITKMLRVSTPLKILEAMLMEKVDNTEDNISDYFLTISGTRYKIKSVNEVGITLERL